MIEPKKFPDSAYDRSPEFMETQFYFAQKASEILKIPPKDALLRYTELYFLLKTPELNEEMDPALSKILENKQPLHTLTSQLMKFIKEYTTGRNYTRANTCGCMGLNIDEEERTVQWHTLPYPVDKCTPSVFKKTEVSQRRQELTELTKFIYDNYKDKVDTIFTYSWLFNIEAATRFFPKKFAQSGKVVQEGYRGLAVWGQFLDKTYDLRTELVKKFKHNLDQAKTEKDLFNSFPYKTIRLESDINEFYNEFLNK